MDRDRAKRMASKKEGKREIKRERVKRREIATSGGVSNCHFTSLKLSPYPSLPVCLSICLSVCLSICLSTHVSIYLSICLSLRLLLFLSPSSSIYSVCVFCVCVYIVWGNFGRARVHSSPWSSSAKSSKIIKIDITLRWSLNILPN